MIQADLLRAIVRSVREHPNADVDAVAAYIESLIEQAVAAAMREVGDLPAAARAVIRATWALSDHKPFLPGTREGRALDEALADLEDVLRALRPPANAAADGASASR